MSPNPLKVFSLLGLLLVALLSGFFLNVRGVSTENFEVTKSPYVDEYSVPWQGSGLMGLGVDGAGSVWFYMVNGSSVGRFNPSLGSFDEYPIVAKAVVSLNIALVAGGQLAFDDKGRVWFTDALRNSIGMLGPSTGEVKMYPIPTPNSGPLGILYDGRGYIWFTELYGDNIGRLNVNTGLLQELALHISENSGPAMLFMDPEGRVWFTEAFGRRIGSIDMSTTIEGEYTLHEFTPDGLLSPCGIVVLNGVVWIGDHGSADLVKYVPDNGTTTRYPTSPAEAYPVSLPCQLALDKEGRLWFAEHGGNKIGVIQPEEGTMTEYVIPTGPLAITLWLAISPSQDVWFTEYASNKIGVVRPLSQHFVKIESSEETVSLHSGDSKDLVIYLKSGTASASSMELRALQSSMIETRITAEIESKNILLKPGDQQKTTLTVHVDSGAEAGEWILSIQASTTAIIESKFIHVEVSKSESSSSVNLMYVAVLPIIALAGYIYYRRHSRRNTPTTLRSV